MLVHGLWMTGVEMLLLGRRLRGKGFTPVRFRYQSLRIDLSGAAASLAGFASGLAGFKRLHFVGHSLGGLVILKLFEDPRAALFPPGRIVLLGTPYSGSLAAERLAALPFGQRILGPGISDLLSGRIPNWKGRRELGVIAGGLNIGLGRFLGIGGRPGDGTILVKETEIPGATAAVMVRTTHTGLVLSRSTARLTASFLKSGRFLPV